jgi:hypothetical protein
MWAHPGKKLLFMGTELAAWNEWTHDASLDWHLLHDPRRADFTRFLSTAARVYREHPAFWRDDPSWHGFTWIDVADHQNSVMSYARTAGDEHAVVILNFTPVPRERYRIGVPVKSTLDWKAYRIGYEFDFVRTNRVFAGFILDFKQTDVSATLETVIPGLVEFARARAPIPAIGGVVRGYVVPNISITGEVTGFKMPDRIFKDISGHYFDVVTYGTLNFTNYVGVQVGYRSFDVAYLVDTDTGSFTLKGMFFGIVARY